ncbi:unnamed protein product [Prunus armeniaca]|uniref:Uncharacterized protein n=1 Tax=Prunus armeniaca TaxID=36596 RepID=A0A6J5WVJ2_PRUAR|nr:unnamed protein product [Prunus armeniaca]CAB4304057.1 unnamed protein product [Prunus armeniaca]
MAAPSWVAASAPSPCGCMTKEATGPSCCATISATTWRGYSCVPVVTTFVWSYCEAPRTTWATTGAAGTCWQPWETARTRQWAAGTR